MHGTGSSDKANLFPCIIEEFSFFPGLIYPYVLMDEKMRSKKNRLCGKKCANMKPQKIE